MFKFTLFNDLVTVPESETVEVEEAKSTRLWRLLNKMGELDLCSGLLLVLLTLEMLSLVGETEGR